jgi:FYVE zinc finger
MMIGKSKPMTNSNSNSSAFSSGRDISPRWMPSSTGTTLMNSNTTTTSTTTTTMIPDNPGSLFAETGINAYGRHQLQVRVHGAPPWIDNSARTKCALCNKTFGTFTLKHHCRRCGEIICDACSSHRKAVAHPAVNPKAEKPETGQLRVCDRCFRTQDLL